MKYEQGLSMANLMKQRQVEIVEAIEKTREAQHGVVVLRFSDEGKQMEVEILDEAYDENVMVYPG